MESILVSSLFTTSATPTCVVGDKITVIGTVTQFETESTIFKELKVWKAADFVVTAHTPTNHKVTFTQPSEGGSFTVEVEGSAISTGAEVLEGKEVTLTATPTSGYKFNGWTVTGATPADASSATTTFTMGTEDVTIAAAFVPESAETVVYTLDGNVTGGSNGYATESDITQGALSWKVMGNTTMAPWRFGGKKLSGVDRTIYSTTAMSYNISKIDITHGTANGITVNSMTVIVATDASFSSVVSTLNPTFAANGTVTVERPTGYGWSNCYYKIIYNVTVTDESANKFFQLTKIEFTGK